MRYFSFGFAKKSKANGAILLEGYSNANVKDRMLERLKPEGGRLDNYHKNPIILFDHAKDIAFGSMPIGKALETKPDSGGLYTKIQISKSKTEKLTAIRDLVEEEILKTFSIGFDPYADDDDEGGTRLITDWELIEQSLVPVPCNQDSIGSLVKRYEKSGNTFGVHLMKRYAFNAKGAWMASALQQRLFDLLECGTITDKGNAIDAIATLAGVKASVVQAVFAGDLTPTPPEVIKAIATVLSLSPDYLINIDKGDVDALQRAADAGKEKEDMAKKTRAAEVKSAPEETPAKDDEVKPGDKPEEKGLKVQAIVIPKSMFDTAEMAKEYVETHGYKSDAMSETDDEYVFEQEDEKGFDMTKSQKIDMGEGCYGKAAPPKMIEEKSAEEVKPEEKPEDKPEEKSQEEKPEEKATTCEEPKASEKPVEEKTAMASGALAVPQDENPILQEARQTNVLLGMLIQVTQEMSAKLDGMVDKSVQQAQDDATSEASTTPPDDVQKSADSIVQYLKETDKVLKRLGV